MVKRSRPQKKRARPPTPEEKERARQEEAGRQAALEKVEALEDELRKQQAKAEAGDETDETMEVTTPKSPPTPDNGEEPSARKRRGGKRRPESAKVKRRKVEPEEDEEVQDAADLTPEKPRLLDLDPNKALEFYGNFEWTWRGWVPKAFASMLLGQQGVGKSRLLARLIATLTGALPDFPDGQRLEGKPGRVMLVETEGMLGEYLRWLKAYGVSMDMLKIPALPYPETPEGNVPDPTSTIDLVEYLEDLQDYALRYHCLYTVIDSLSGGHELDENSNRMRMLLKAISTELSVRLQQPTIIAHHPRKKHPKEPGYMTVDRARGHSTITQFCRSVVGMWRWDGGMTSPVRVETSKTNFKPPQPFGFVVDDAGLIVPCAAPDGIVTGSETRAKAIEFLIRKLADGPMKSADVRAQARKRGIRKDTLYGAKKDLDVETNNRGEWELPPGNWSRQPEREEE